MRLVLGGYAPEDSTHAAGLAAFRDRVEADGGGRVSVEVVWNVLDQNRPATDLLTMVESGEMFLCYFSTSYVGGRVRALDLLEVPYLFSDLDEAHTALDGPLGTLLAEAVGAQTGFGVLGFWDNGFRHLTNRLRPVRTPADTVGMRVRLQPNALHEEMIRGWGAEPVAVELSEGIELITRGDVDAQENPLANTVAYGVDEVHRYVTMTGHLYGARGLFCNAEVFESLSVELRDLVSTAAREAAAIQRAAAAAKERDLRRLLEASGHEFVDLDPAQRQAFVDASAPARERARRELGDDLWAVMR